MKSKGKVLRICALLVILVFLFLSLAGCEEKSKEDAFKEDSSLNIEKIQAAAEQLKLESDKLMQIIKESEKLKSEYSTTSDIGNKEEMRRLKELYENSLKESKEIKEKIKAIQESK